MGRRPFYADYVNHCLRFYHRNMEKSSAFESEVDNLNWYACDAILRNRTAKERSILAAVYCENDTLADNVYNAAKKFRVEQGTIWNLIVEVSQKIAKHRGLI